MIHFLRCLLEGCVSTACLLAMMGLMPFVCLFLAADMILGYTLRGWRSLVQEAAARMTATEEPRHFRVYGESEQARRN